MLLTPKPTNETGREYALRTIKDNIVSLDLAPGSAVSENALAAEMGLSRTPVREALIELAKVKIVTIAPQKKSIISKIDYSLVEEARFMRNVLECAVVELVCQLRTEDDLRKLGENVKLQRFHMENKALENVMDLDNQFHQMLFDIAHKSLAYQMIQNMAIHFDRVRKLSLVTLKDMIIVRDHEQLTEALKFRDSRKATALMDLHLNRYKCDEQAIRDAYPQYFK